MQPLQALLSDAQRAERAQQFAQALTAYERLVRLAPDNHRVWHLFGLCSLSADLLPNAVEQVTQATRLAPHVGLYWRNLCELQRRAGALKRAEEAGLQAVRLLPADVDAQYNLGLALVDAERYEQAERHLRKALDLNPRHGTAWNNLGTALERQDDLVGAKKAYQRAVSLDETNAQAQHNLGAAFSAEGNLDSAKAHFIKAIDHAPDLVEAHYNLSGLKTYTSDDPHLSQLRGMAQSIRQAGLTTQIRYYFALGKALEDAGDYDDAFGAYAQGNRLEFESINFDDGAGEAMLDAIVDTYDEAFFSERTPSDAHGYTPIFIVGMPRSGTTLLEQILCSHDSVYGAGELIDFSEALQGVAGSTSDNPPILNAARLDPAAFTALGNAYLSRVQALSPGSSFISDKMPGNFFHAALIHLALPDARIIHAMRDPMDSCFSCFSRYFNDTMDFAYDQGTLGRYYQRYIRLMNHWHKVLPAGRILDMRYEELVNDTEAQARRLLDYVGLPWDPGCLEFHRNTRPVKTASMAQVRKPIYQSSVARWRNFEAHLGPLLSEVAHLRPEGAKAGSAVEAKANATAKKRSKSRQTGRAQSQGVELTDVDKRILARLDTIKAQQDTGQHEDALTALNSVIESHASSAKAHHLKGISHYALGELDAAIESFDQALTLNPGALQPANSKAFVLLAKNRPDEALALLKQIVDAAPNFQLARFNLATAQLKLGDWSNGWRNYESRWHGSAEADQGRQQRPHCTLPTWRGEAVSNSDAIIVFTEQGFGDVFQFCRYLTLLADRFKRITFVCSAPTARLMEWTFQDRVHVLTSMPQDFRIWNWQIDLMSLPNAFNTTLDNVPFAEPYLRAPQAAVDYWRDRLELSAPTPVRIGIAWSGRASHQANRVRSMALSQLHPLLRDTRFTWVSLQKWNEDQEIRDLPPEANWIDWTTEMQDFADSAALVSSLDLVITIDSAPAHLSAALGRPTWLLNRFDGEWRWLWNREDSVWYPSVRVFNQASRGDWSGVVARVGQALDAMATAQES